jgi:two-component system LytT family sensor kinase
MRLLVECFCRSLHFQVNCPMNKPNYKPWVYNLLPVLVWFLLLVLPFVNGPPNIPEWMRHRFVTNIVTSNVILLALFYINTYLLYPIIQKRGWFTYLCLLGALLACYWVCWFFLREIPPHLPAEELARQRWEQLQHPGQKMHFGPMRGGPGTFMPIISSFIALLCSFCYRIILDDNARQQLVKERETIHLRTELNFLRSQINPHFLFNVLNNLTSLARKKSDRIEPAIMNLSQLMRYMLYESDDNRVPLDKEIAYLKSYIELQLLRFGDEVSVKMDLDGSHPGLNIGPMLLISLVENAFKHGTDGVGQSVINIVLNISTNQRLLYFTIINDVKKGEKAAEVREGIGLKNLKRRLDILYPCKHQLAITDDGAIFSAMLELELS